MMLCMILIVQQYSHPCAPIPSPSVEPAVRSRVAHAMALWVTCCHDSSSIEGQDLDEVTNAHGIYKVVVSLGPPA